MKKSLFLVFILVISVFSIMNLSASDEEIKFFEVNTPINKISFNEKIVLSITAPKDTVVDINIINLDTNSYKEVSEELESSKNKLIFLDNQNTRYDMLLEFDSYYSEKATIGAINRLWREIKLEPGINIMMFSLEFPGGEKAFYFQEIRYEENKNLREFIPADTRMSTTEIIEYIRTITDN